MLTDPQRDQLKQALRPMQIIVAAMAFGVATFVVIALVLAPWFAVGGQRPEPFLTYIAIGFTAVVSIIWVVVPRLIGVQMLNSIASGQWRSANPAGPNAAELGDVGPLTVAHQTRLIISSALLEGIALFNVVAYMLEQQPVCLGVAGVMIFILLSQFPTFGRLQSSIEVELATLKQLRAMGSQHGR